MYERRTALLAAALTAASSTLVEYSTNARGYTIVTLLFIALAALAFRLRTSPNRAEWLAFAVLAAIGLFTVPVMLYALIALVAWLAIELRRDVRSIAKRLLPTVGATGALTVLLYAPIIATHGIGALVRNEFVRPLPFDTFAGELPGSVASVARFWHRDLPLPFAIALGIGLVIALAFHRRLNRTAWPLLAVAIVAIAPVVVAQRVVPFERVWLFLLPLYLITASAGLVLLAEPLLRRARDATPVVAAVAVALAVGLAAAGIESQSVHESEETSTFRDSEAVAALLARELGPDDKVVVLPPADAILEYQLRRRGLSPAELLYWDDAGGTRRFLAVVKEGPDDYPLEHVLADARLDSVRTSPARVLQRFDEATVYEVRRAA